ncbi:MAG: hypothetical protein ACRD12_15685, partial [Acidimicrobiales bacterium]
MRRMAVLAALLGIHVLGAAAPALAGGTHLYPVRERYEVGEVATLVGYTSGGALGWVQDGPFLAYLIAGDTPAWADRRLPPDSIPLGPLNLEARGRSVRVSLSFRVPDLSAAGVYTITYCNDPCTTGLGDLIGGSVAIGVDPPRAVLREWHPDDPEIANLAADAVITGPGGPYTAADLRASRVTPPAWGSDSAPPPGPDRRATPPSILPPAEAARPSAVVTPAAVPDPSPPTAPHGPVGQRLI